MSDTAPQYVLALACPDRPGIVHAVSGLIAEDGGNIVESQQFGSADSGRFFMRVHIETPVPGGELHARVGELARRFDMRWTLDIVGRPMRTLVMVSREAHCLTDLLFRRKASLLPIEIPLIVGNHTDLAGLAAFYEVPFEHVPISAGSKDHAEARLLELVEAHDIELVVLARYMQVLSDALCARLAGRIINIHHSFLPSFKGARPYHQAHRRGVKLIGATAHYATADLDEGPIIEQDVERVHHAAAPRDLVAQGQDVERRVLARAVRWHAEHRVLLDGHRTVVFQ